MILIRRFRTTLEKKHKVSFINKNTSYDILEGDSIVTSSNNQGGKLPFSCMQGMCTTCIAKVIKGEFKYIEEPEPDTLSQEDIENNSVLLCIATPLTDPNPGMAPTNRPITTPIMAKPKLTGSSAINIPSNK